MYTRLLATLGAVALALSLAGIVSADTGNVATNSIGSVQASALSAAPDLSTVTPDATVASTAPTSIASDNGNTADGSTGSAQLGGGNTATDSVVSGQLATTKTAPAFVAKVLGHKASVASTGTAGNASNSASNGLVTVQPGNPSVSGTASTTGRRLITVHRSSLKKAATVTPPSRSAVVLPTVPSTSNLNDVSASATPQVTHNIVIHPKSATVRPAFAVAPNTQLGVGQVAQTQTGGTVGLAHNPGDSATHSFGTVQGGALQASPAFAFMSPSEELALMLGGSNGVDGGAPNSASDSIGTVQVGSGNEADPSLGTIQIGSLRLGPTLALSSPNGTTGLGGSTGIAGGNNSANNSNGTVQIGGNSANGSNGTVQVAPLTENEQGTFGSTPAGSGSVGAPEQIGSGPILNSATNSTGTVQVGAGNSSTGSIGTVQAGGSSPSAPTGGETTGPPTGSGPGTDNGGTPSPGTPGAGTPISYTAATSAGVTESAQAPLSSTRTATAAAAAAAATAKKAGAAASRSGANSASSASRAGSPSTAAASPSSGSNGTSVLGTTLPFTGFALMLALVLGLGLVGVGTAVRRLVATS